MDDQERAERVKNVTEKIGALQVELWFLNGGCNAFFSPDGIESVKCGHGHMCPACEANPPAAIGGSGSPPEDPPSNAESDQ